MSKMSKYQEGGMVLSYLRGHISDEVEAKQARYLLVKHLIQTKRAHDIHSAESFVHGISSYGAERIFTEIVTKK